MQPNNRHNPKRKGLKLNSDRFFAAMRHPATKLITGLMLVGGLINKLSHDPDSYIKKETGPRITTAYTPADAMDATLLAQYGENYERGTYPELDVVVDTATTSKGLHDGVQILLGDPLDNKLLYAKRVVNDTVLANDLYQKSYNDLRMELLGKKTGSMQLSSPLNRIHITSNFGQRHVRNVSRASRYHYGTDFRAKPGTEVFAVMKSKLVTSKIDHKNSVGYVVMDALDEAGQPNGYRFRYFHVVLADQSKVGQIFEAGETVTTVARHHQYGHETSSGPHLHFEVQKKDPRTGKYATLNSTTITRNDFVLPGIKQGPKLHNKFGSYMADAIKKDESGNVLVMIDMQLEQQLNSGEITRVEYQRRKTGMNAVFNEVRGRAYGMFQEEKKIADLLMQRTAKAMDQAKRPKNMMAKPVAFYSTYTKPFAVEQFAINSATLLPVKTVDMKEKMTTFDDAKLQIIDPVMRVKPLQVAHYSTVRRQQILTPEI